MKYYHHQHELYKVGNNSITIYTIHCGETPIPEVELTQLEEGESAEENIEDLIELGCELKEITEKEFNELYTIWFSLYCEWENFKHLASKAIGQFY